MEKMTRIQETLTRMLHDRGYNLYLETEYGTIWSRPDAPNLFVLSNIFDQLAIDGLKEYKIKCEALHIRHGIVVYRDSITSDARKGIACRDTIHIEAFCEHELVFPIVDHVLQPKFVVCSETDRARIEARYGQLGLPKMKLDDPVVRYYNWPRDTIVRIEPKITKLQPSYRIVK